jgi:hypothetical protein
MHPCTAAWLRPALRLYSDQKKRGTDQTTRSTSIQEHNRNPRRGVEVKRWLQTSSPRWQTTCHGGVSIPASLRASEIEETAGKQEWLTMGTAVQPVEVEEDRGTPATCARTTQRRSEHGTDVSQPVHRAPPDPPATVALMASGVKSPNWRSIELGRDRG